MGQGGGPPRSDTPSTGGDAPGTAQGAGRGGVREDRHGRAAQLRVGHRRAGHQHTAHHGHLVGDVRQRDRRAAPDRGDRRVADQRYLLAAVAGALALAFAGDGTIEATVWLRAGFSGVCLVPALLRAPVASERSGLSSFIPTLRLAVRRLRARARRLLPCLGPKALPERCLARARITRCGFPMTPPLRSKRHGSTLGPAQHVAPSTGSRSLATAVGARFRVLERGLQTGRIRV